MDRVKKKVFFVEVLFLAFVLLIGWKLRVRSLYFAVRIGEVFLLTAIFKILPLMELSANDLIAVAFSVLLNNVVLLHPRFGRLVFSDAILFTFLFLLELLVLVKRVHQRKRGYGITVGYAVLCCLGVLCIYHKWERFALDYYCAREGEFGFAVKALYVFVSIVIISVPLFLIIRCFSAFSKKWLIKLQEYSMTYAEIDRSIILVIILTLGTLSMRELLPFLPADNTYELSMLWLGLCTIIVIVQVIYVRLLVKSISVKEKMRLQEKDLYRLAEYNRELEKNMQNMRGIGHDIKNMFLTMGGFVDRSNDEEMKVFYEENIVPFAKQELRKNDLYVKLSCIHNEGLKSFLYFKMMQGIEQNVSVDLLVQLADTNDIFGIEQIDLIRILGILIDNAIEEAKVCKGTVIIAMKESEREYLFSVSNTVRRQIREKGVIAGTTDKGLGRGNGLLIVESLIRKYRNVLLNSFFKENEFVQCLRVGK